MPAMVFLFAGRTRSYRAITMQADKPGHASLRKGRVSQSNGIYLITATTIGRARLFENFHAACAASRCFEDKVILGNSAMLAWVLMPDHSHWLVELGEHEALGKLVNRIKSASARHANRVLKRAGALWSAAYHDHALRTEDDLPDTARYIVANPLRAGLVKHLGDYPFWNAIWL